MLEEMTPSKMALSMRAKVGVNLMGSILYIIGAVLVALWLIGFLTHIGGGLIHIILVIAVIVFIFQFLSGRRSV
jgi:hypothetical protein